VVDARPPLRRDWWGKARGCPSPACLQRSWWSSTPLFVLWSDRHFVQKAARRQIWHRSVTANRMCVTVASVDYPDACMARGSQSNFPQALQPLPCQHTPTPICSQGVRGYLSAQASVNKQGHSVCITLGALPEFGSSNAITRESKVWASGLSPPFGGLLWAARSAVACPGCPWDGAAWHGGCALLPRWWSAPAAPSCRGSRFDSSCRVPAAGGYAPPAAGIRPRAEAPRRQPADAADADAALRAPDRKSVV